MKSQPIVVKKSIGPLGSLLEISPPEAMPHDVLEAKIRGEVINSPLSEGAKREAISALGVQYPDVCFVLDISASMGDHVRRSRMAVNAAMLQCAYLSSSRINFITFTCEAQQIQVNGHNPSVNDLVTTLQHVLCSGGTNVAGVFPLLPSFLRPIDPVTAANPKILIVISDGEIADKDQALAAAQRVSQALGVAQVPTYGVLLRLLTSPWADPDTQALACFGSFCTENTVLVDVPVHQDAEVGLSTLTEAIASGIRNAGIGASVNITSSDGTSIFRRLPGGPALSHLCVQAGSRTEVLVDPNAPLDTILIDGEPVSVVDGGVIDNEEAMSSILSFIDQQFRMRILSGQTENLLIMKTWLEKLQAYLSNVESVSLSGGDLSLASRAIGIQRSIQKRQGTIVSRILEMEGSDRVKGMNAQQQADWLRKANDNRSGRSLARRAHKVARATGELNYLGQCQDVVKYIGSQPSFVATDGEESSFYSLSTGSDGMIALQTELCHLADDLTIADVLPIAGLVGVPIAAFVGDYVDPYAIRPRNVFCGQYLAEADLWLIRSQASDANVEFSCPGHPDSNITGVVALRRCNPQLYDFMLQKSVRPLFEMQVSAQMRHMVSVIPQDAIALNVCSIGTLVQILALEGKLTFVERDTLHAMMENIMVLIGPKGYNPESFLEMYSSLRHDDPRAWLSGDRNISNVMKVFAVLIRYYVGENGQPDASVNLARVFRALYYLDTYYFMKRMVKGDDPNARPNLIKWTLGIDFDKHATPLRPLLEPEPDNPAHYDTVVLESLTIPEGVPLPRYYSAWNSVLTQREAIPDDVETFGGISGPSIRAVATVQALLCASEGDRINTADRTCHLPDPTTDVDALAYLRGVVRSQYGAEYETRLASKRQQEAQIMLDRQVKELIDATYDDFKSILLGPQSMIPNRDCKGFPMILDSVLDLNVVVANRLKKLVLLVTGRELGAPTVPLWCNGNILLTHWHEIALLTTQCDAEDLMSTLREMRKQHAVHTYRDKANRHNHSNDFPSYWAMGYKDLHEFMEIDPTECRRYVDLHCIKERCCLPNAVTSKEWGIDLF